MNKARRKEIKKAIALFNEGQAKVSEARDILEACKDEETEYRENMPESLQDSEKAQKADESIDAMESADSFIENALEEIDSITANLESAISDAETAAE